MLKNELIKFFNPLKISCYIIFLLVSILLPVVIFSDKINTSITIYNYIYDNMWDVLVFIIPIILAPIVSNIFTQDYESGCLKFFILYKKRGEIFFYKVVGLITIASMLVLTSFLIISIIYFIKISGNFNSIINDFTQIFKLMVLFILTLIPILLIYVFISIMFSNSTIISLLTFLLVMMSDLFVKYIADIMPTRFYRTFLTKGHAVDNFSLFLFLAYLIIFTLLSWKIFSKKEILR
ncbi:hypothetical protein FDF31_00675 [Clostridium sporogenes]|uniref:hypothetical protein n=1 Tax=unclassified Clostridium TaxID=2614128 RepID=UPI0013D80176|nr:hypothetical protein [Clostridium sporogenes]NFS24227.1 hypothetical protein [Clostridium sporogenes]